MVYILPDDGGWQPKHVERNKFYLHECNCRFKKGTYVVAVLDCTVLGVFYEIKKALCVDHIRVSVCLSVFLCVCNLASSTKPFVRFSQNLA